VSRGKIFDYNAEPTARLFHNDNTRYRFLQGPVGCGKSAACVMELLQRSFKQEPYNGVRSTRWCVTRSTYPELKSTTIKTFQQWLPQEVCPVVYDVPIRAKFRQPLHDKTVVEAEFVFLALETEEDVSKLLSFELTGIWCNEIRELPKEVFDYARGRLPRWPPEREGGATWHGIISDTNPPKVGHWLYDLFESESGPPEGFKLYKYPSAVYFDSRTNSYQPNPDAENLRNLAPSYYKDQISGNSETYIRNMLLGEYGISLKGKPIFPQFNQRVHVSKETIRPDRGLPLLLCWDFGLNPACIFMQMSRRGKVCIVDELAPADEDLESFCQDYVMPLLNQKYAGYSVQCVGDPAARGRSGLDKRTAFDVLVAFGLRLTLAPTNAFTPRKEAVDYFLNRTEGLIISPHCQYIVEAFTGGYVYEKMKQSMAGADRFKEKAEKNEYSHGMDAVQYGCLYYLKGSGVQRAGRMLNGLGNDKKPEKKFLWA
jgi:hypothetical protein